MRIVLPICILFFATLLHSVEPLSENSLNRLKAATVYIKTNYGTGSGFLLREFADGGFIGTNHHVVHSRSHVPSRAIQVVFHSGTKKEFALPAKLIASNKDMDLAILEVKSGLLPKPINIKKDLKLRETLPLFMLGFPLGELLSSRKGNPEVTVGTGTISSLRKNNWGDLEVVQIDGDINPGNSGGPVVTPEGDLVGVAVSTYMGTQLSQVVPYESMESMLHGFAHKTSWQVLEESDKQMKCRVTMTFTDPLRKVKSPYFYYAEKSKVGSLPKPDTENGRYTKAIPKMKKVKMEHEGVLASLEFTIKGDGKAKMYYFQYSFTDAMGKRRFLWPTEHNMTFAGGADSGRGERSTGSTGSTSKSEKKVSENLIEEDEFEFNQIDMGETIVKTPKKIINAIVAGGGRHLVIQYEDMPLLVVYDIATRKILHNIRIPGRNFIYTAGGYKALVYLKENNLLSSFDLKTGKKLKTKVNPFGAVICHMLMGNMNDSIAFIRSASGTDALSRAQNNLLKMSTLTAYSIADDNKRAATGHNSSYRDFVHRRCSPDMQFITEWCTSHSPQGFGTYKRYKNKIVSKYEHSTFGYLAVGEGGMVFTGNGRIYNSDIKFISQLDGKSLFPGIGSTMFLGMDKVGKFTVYVAGNYTPVATIADMDYMKDFEKNRWTKTTFTLDRRVIFNPKYNSILLIPSTDDKIIHRGFNLEETLKGSGVDYLFMVSQPIQQATRGTKYEYELKAKSSTGKVKFDLEFGPDGMKLSNGVLTWTPGSKALEKESVIILVEDSGGEQIYHNFDIFVQ